MNIQLWLSTSCYLLHSHNVNCIGNLSNGTYDWNREIDFEILFNACTTLGVAKRLHALLIVSGKAQSSFVATRLVNIYSHLGDVSSSRETFNQVPRKDAYTWNSMVSAYVRNRRFSEAVECAYEMLLSADARPDFHTFPPVLKACNSLLDGTRLHCWILKLGLEWDVFVAASLVHLYCRFGFSGYAKPRYGMLELYDFWILPNGNAEAALSILGDMGLEGIEMDSVTVATVLSICAQKNDVLHGALIHLFAIKHGLEFNVFVSNALINMYAKFGELKCAQNVFDHMDVRDLVSWNSIIAAYEQNYYPYDALKFFREMQSNKVKPDLLTIVMLKMVFASEAIEVFSRMKEDNDLRPNQGTWVSIIPAYAHLGALRDGMRVHGHVLKEGLDSDVFVSTCLIDLYGKCGRLGEALSLFYEASKETSVPWNAIISCHGLHGLGETSLRLFRDMLNEGIKPDHVTFLSLLTACSHSDLFGRAGLLETAYNFIASMPLRPDASIWGALLGACKIHGNVEMGRKASSYLFEIDSENVGYYVLLSNLYANFGHWEGVGEVRSLARGRGLWKTPGWSSIELNNRIEVFYTGSQSHPQIEDDEKETILSSHSERLAIVYGILNTPPKTSIRIFKNLRVCGDCHSVTKFISKLMEREIIRKFRSPGVFSVEIEALCSGNFMSFLIHHVPDGYISLILARILFLFSRLHFPPASLLILSPFSFFQTLRRDYLLCVHLFPSQDTEKEKIAKAKSMGASDGKESKLCFHEVKNQENFEVPAPPLRTN
ncbi:UNVERIFIED_CONTAM: Pentatricopeptide repeat-containing protein, partial [Sesamum angustifolium]